jgi:RND family efflux transporter MFP subunit
MTPDITPKSPLSRGVAIAVCGLLIVVLGFAAYRYRGKFVQIPFVGNWLAKPINQSTQHVDHAGDGSPSGNQLPTANVEPRVSVNLDTRRQQLIGVRTVLVERSTLSPTVRTVGVVRYDETRQTDVNVKIEGWIRDLYVNFTGQSVAKGQPLFEYYSPDLMGTEKELILALQTKDRIAQSAIADARDYSARMVDSARQRLALWDLDPEEIKRVEDAQESNGTTVFRSPTNGYVIEKQALQGLHVMPGQTLFKIADLSSVWVEAEVYDQEASFLEVGRMATVTLDAYPGEQFRGRATYIYPFVAEQTRTVRVRFAFDNPRGRFKPGMYANVELQGPVSSGLSVPINALLDSGQQQYVFVALGDGYFEPRRVTVGRRMADRVEILKGLKKDEEVAMSAAFFLDSESQLRAGLEDYESTGTPRTSTSGTRLDIGFRPLNDPPKAGENTFEAILKDASGQPVADAEVTVDFVMPAMPSMNMPAVHIQIKLASMGGGKYQGTGEIMTSGRWDVMVSVTRGGQRVDSKELSMTVR